MRTGKKKFSPSPGSSPSQSSLDDSPWIISIRQELNEAREYEASSNWKTQTIYRVPKILRELDESGAYTPQLVSIGPYHRGRPNLEEMNRHKWRALHHALRRTGHDVCLYLDAVRGLEDRARRCYEASLEISSDDFVKTLLLDSIFLLEIFRGVVFNNFEENYDLHDPVFSIYSNLYSLQADMILLENQLPLFVLDRILALQLEDNQPGLVATLAFHFFQPIRLTDETFASSLFYRNSFYDKAFASSKFFFYTDNNNENTSSSKALHCLGVFHHRLHFPEQKQPVVNNQWRQLIHRVAHCMDQKSHSQPQLIHCVDDLRKAGIKFRLRRSDSFLDIKFKNGVLQIPRICIERSTKSLFLNLIAFELCHLECTNYIISYVIFMDSLINSEVDVKFLHDKGIIKHWLGNDGEVADMFNRLTSKVAFDINNCYLSELYRQVDIYYNQRWNTWRASFIHKHFSNPWTIISLVAAVILLLLTFAQTFYTMYAYHKPRS